MRGFKRLSKTAIVPKRSTRFSAAYDFSVPDDREIIIHPQEVVKVSTGIAAYMEQDEYLSIYIRSSVGIKKGLTLANGTGIIDSDYFGNVDNGGNIILAVKNNTNETVILQPKERIAQGIFLKYLVTDKDDCGKIREGGIGSTGE